MKTVLVIDESRAHVAAAKDILENDRPRRFRVVHCNTCDAGFITAVREQPDMILLDQFSPQMIGLELLERLMRDPRTADIPVAIPRCAIPGGREDPSLLAWGAGVPGEAGRSSRVALRGEFHDRGHTP